MTATTPGGVVTPHDQDVARSPVGHTVPPQEDVLYANTIGVRRSSPPRTDFESSQTPHVGLNDTGQGTVICHYCYEAGHNAPQCNSHINQIDLVVRNYEALDDQTRAKVPSRSYEEAKTYLEFQAARAASKETTDDGDSKKLRGGLRGMLRNF